MILLKTWMLLVVPFETGFPEYDEVFFNYWKHSNQVLIEKTFDIWNLNRKRNKNQKGVEICLLAWRNLISLIRFKVSKDDCSQGLQMIVLKEKTPQIPIVHHSSSRISKYSVFRIHISMWTESIIANYKITNYFKNNGKTPFTVIWIRSMFLFHFSFLEFGTWNSKSPKMKS